jgi:predicted phosphodiesterase
MVYRILVLNDIHSNLAALKAVLSDAQQRGPFHAKVCGGDIIGYGPDPNAVIDILNKERVIAVMGNHDKIATVKGDVSYFNLEAITALCHNLSQLTPTNRAYINSLAGSLQGKLFSVTHGSFKQQGNFPFNFEYVIEHEQARQSLAGMHQLYPLRHTQLGIFGHSHIPTYAYCLIDYEDNIRHFRFVTYSGCHLPPSEHSHPSCLKENYPLTREQKVTLPRREGNNHISLTIFNPGSVGQPRHGSPAACYGIAEIHGKTIQLRFLSVMYAVEDTQRRIIEENLPKNLAHRLEEGR